MLYEQEFQKFVALHKEVKELEAAAKAKRKDKEKLGEQILELLTQLGTDTVGVGDTTIYIYEQTRASIKAGMEAEATKMLTDLGYGEIVETTAKPQRVAALVRELKSKNMLPPELHEVLNIYDQIEVRARG
jgi:hypothetical protein